MALISKSAIDIATKNSNGNFKHTLFLLIGIITSQIALNVFMSMLSVRVLGKTSINLKEMLFRQILNKDIQRVNSYHSGELMNRLNTDVSFIANGLISIVPTALSLGTQAIFGFIALYSLDKELSTIVLSVCPFIFIAGSIYGKKIKIFHKKVLASDGKTRSFMQESLQNLLVLKSFSNEENIMKHAGSLQETNYKISIKKNTISIFANVSFYIIMTAGYYVSFAWCAYKISMGAMTFGTLTAILQLISRVQSPFSEAVSIIPQFYGVVASIERIKEIVDLPDEQSINRESIDYQSLYNQLDQIEFRNLSFGYENQLVIDNLSSILVKNQFISITGMSGIGKSTLLKLLLGIHTPWDGDILLKTSSGDRISVDKRTRKLFAYVPQGNMILSGTIRENIVFSSDSSDEKRLEESTKIAEISSFIQSLPDGFNTVIGEGGFGLSEGQTQRLAIARAIYCDAPILLLDEVTSGLDARTEWKILNNIKQLSNKTCILVSHKDAANEICDASINLENNGYKSSAFERNAFILH